MRQQEKQTQKTPQAPQPLSQLESVREFYKAFKQEKYLAGPTAGFHNIPDPERVNLKVDLIAEEFIELLEAVYGVHIGARVERAWEELKLTPGIAPTPESTPRTPHTPDIIETADALADMIYVINGAALELGIPLDEVFKEVHASNMSKLDEQGQPIVSDGVTPAPHDGKVKPQGKILKGKNFFEPNIKEALKRGNK